LIELACCVRVIDIGTQNIKASSGATQKREIVLGWELILASENQKRLMQIVYKSYELNLTEGSTLRQDLQSWLGEGFKVDGVKRFTPKSLLGKYCNLELTPTSNDDGIQNFEVKVVAPIPIETDKGTLPKPLTSFQIFTISEPDLELLESLPVEIKNQIKNSAEYVWSQEHKSISDDY
jgi:hypothetical protein